MFIFGKKKKLEKFESELFEWEDILFQKEENLKSFEEDLNKRSLEINEILKKYPNALSFKREKNDFAKAKNIFEQESKAFYDKYKTEKERQDFINKIEAFNKQKKKIDLLLNFSCYVFGIDFTRLSVDTKKSFVEKMSENTLSFANTTEFANLKRKEEKYGLLDYYSYYIPEYIKNDDRSGYLYIGLFTNDKEHKNGIKIGGTKNSDFSKRESRTINPHYKIVYVSKKLDDWKKEENYIHGKYKKNNLKNKNNCKEWFEYKIIDSVLSLSEYEFKKV